MEMARFVDSLAADVAAVAAIGDEQTRAAAERVLQAIRGSAGLRLLDALGEAALEISGQLPEGHIEVRLVGQDPALVYVGEEAAPPEPAAEDGLTSRITLRLPESLKASIEADAAREGISVNSLIVRALSRGAGGRVSDPANGSKATARAEKEGESDGDQVLSTAFRTRRSARRQAAGQAGTPSEKAMRRETFDTPGPLELNVRVPSGEVDLETVEGTETVVELSASPELEEEARIELHPKRDGHEVSVVIEKRSGLFRSFRGDIRLRITVRRERISTSRPLRPTSMPAATSALRR